MISTVVWYSSGKLYSIRVVVYESSICASIFCRSPRSKSGSVINYWVFLFTSSSSYLESLLHSLIFETYVVGSNSLESFSALVFCVIVYDTHIVKTLDPVIPEVTDQKVTLLFCGI